MWIGTLLVAFSIDVKHHGHALFPDIDAPWRHKIPVGTERTIPQDTSVIIDWALDRNDRWLVEVLRLRVDILDETGVVLPAHVAMTANRKLPVNRDIATLVVDPHRVNAE